MREIPLMKEFFGVYRHPNVRLFRRNIIDDTMQNLHTGRIIKVKAGIPGQADAYAFIKRPSLPAVNLEIEFKGARTPVSDEQKRWKLFCSLWGVPHLILRASEDEESLQTLARWMRELNSCVSQFV